VQLHVVDGPEESLKAFFRIVQQSVAGDDQLSSTVPDGSANEAVVGPLRTLPTAGAGAGIVPPQRILSSTMFGSTPRTRKLHFLLARVQNGVDRDVQR
jgi:hypothetical protein